VRITHVAFDFGFGHERRDRIDDNDVDCSRAYQDLANFERLLTRVRLRDQQRLDVDAQLSRVIGVERVLRVDVRRDAAGLLRVRDDMQAERRLSARLGSIDLSDATAGNAAHADRRIEIDRTGRNRLDADLLIRSEPHDRALTTALFDLRDGQIQRLLLVVLQSRHSHFSLILSVSRSPLWPCSVIVPGKRSIRYPNKIRRSGSGFKPNSEVKRHLGRVGLARGHLRPIHRPRRIDTTPSACRAYRSRLKLNELTPSACSS
jgi:hypothetical protein